MIPSQMQPQRFQFQNTRPAFARQQVAVRHQQQPAQTARSFALDSSAGQAGGANFMNSFMPLFQQMFKLLQMMMGQFTGQQPNQNQPLPNYPQPLPAPIPAPTPAADGGVVPNPAPVPTPANDGGVLYPVPTPVPPPANDGGVLYPVPTPPPANDGGPVCNYPGTPVPTPVPTPTPGTPAPTPTPGTPAPTPTPGTPAPTPTPGTPAPTPTPGTPAPTPTPGTPAPTPTPTPDQGPDVSQQVNDAIQNSPVDRDLVFRGQALDVKTSLGLNNDQRAIVHLWGRQTLTSGKQNGDIYLTVLQAGSPFTAAEKNLVRNSVNNEFDAAGVPQNQRFLADGSINPAQATKLNGTALDKAFFDLKDQMAGVPVGTTAQAYANRPIHNSSGQPLVIINDLNQIQQNTGLNTFEQSVLRLWGHDPLTNGGTIDGSVLAYTIGNTNALDSNANSGGNNIDTQARALLEDDFIVDGNMNGGSLRQNFTQVMDKIYQVDSNGDGVLGTSQAQSRTEALAAAKASGRTAADITRDMTMGVSQAVSKAADVVLKHPVASVAAAGGLAAAAAVCPFLAGLGAGAVGVGLASQALNANNDKKAAAAANPAAPLPA